MPYAMAYIVWRMLQPRMNRVRHIAYMHRWFVVVVLLLLIQTLSIVDGHPKLMNDGISDKHGQRFAMEPQDQTAIVGSRVTLPCRVIGKQGTLQWTKDDFGLGWHRNLSGFERYKMIGSDEEGDFSLGMSTRNQHLLLLFAISVLLYCVCIDLASLCRYLSSNVRRRCSISMSSGAWTAR